MPTIARNIYFNNRLPILEQSTAGRQSFIIYESTPPDQLLTLLKQNLFDVRVSGYATEEQWEGYKIEIVNLKIKEHDEGIAFLLNHNNLYVKGYPLKQGETSVVFYVDDET